MRSQSRLRLLLALPLLLTLACGGGASSPTAPAPEALLLGRVHVVPNGPGIVGATVNTQGRTTFTVADGNFNLPHLALGSTTVTLTAAGYRTATLQLTLVEGNNSFSLGMEPAP